MHAFSTMATAKTNFPAHNVTIVANFRSVACQRYSTLPVFVLNKIILKNMQTSAKIPAGERAKKTFVTLSNDINVSRKLEHKEICTDIKHAAYMGSL